MKKIKLNDDTVVVPNEVGDDKLNNNERKFKIVNCKIGEGTVIADPEQVYLENCEIGKNCYIGRFTQLINVKIGDNTKIYNCVNMYGPNTSVGSNCKVGHATELQCDVLVGNDVTISSHSFCCSGVTIEGNNFLGHFFCAINDLKPSHNNPNYEQKKTIIKKSANIGSNVTLFPIYVGENSLIGAGSIVRTTVPPGHIVAGNPAKFIRMV